MWPPHPPVSLMTTQPTPSGGCWTYDGGVRGFSTWWTGQVTVLRSDAGCHVASYWIRPSSLISTVHTLTSMVDRLEAFLEGGALSWSPPVSCVCLCVSLSVCVWACVGVGLVLAFQIGAPVSGHLISLTWLPSSPQPPLYKSPGLPATRCQIVFTFSVR